MVFSSNTIVRPRCALPRAFMIGAKALAFPGSSADLVPLHAGRDYNDLLAVTGV